MEATEVLLFNRNRPNIVWFVGLLLIFLISVQVWADAGQVTTIKKQSASSNPIPIKVLPLKSFKDCSDCPEMVVLPAGQYLMGATEQEFIKGNVPRFMYITDLPQHKVSVKSFAIARYDVTKADFAAFVRATGYNVMGCKVQVKLPFSIFGGSYTWKYHSEASWQDLGFAQTDQDPVICVSWDDAHRYVAWLNEKVLKTHPMPKSNKLLYRLPSEAEWEYAVRAGTTTLRFWGDDVAAQCLYANGRDLTEQEKFPDADAKKSLTAPCRDGYAKTSPVGSYHPNAWGLYDMLGDVGQWTEDCVHLNYSGAPLNGTAWTSNCAGTYKEVRGGGWATASWYIISPAHTGVDPSRRSDDIGFRIVRDIQ